MSNNKYFKCPANISDSRGVNTDFKGNGYNNLKIINNNNIKTSYQYRQELQKNGKNIVIQKPFGCENNNVPHGVINIDTNIMLSNVNNDSSYKSVFKNVKPYA